MKVLVLPSWWPTRDHLFGVFFKEQVERLAELHPEHEFVVLYWGNSELELHPSKLRSTLRNWASFSELPLPPKKLSNLTFITAPILGIPRRLGGVAHQLRGVRRLLKRRLPGAKFDLIHALVGHPAGIIARSLAEDFEIPYMITEVMGPFPFAHLRESSGAIWPPLRAAYESAALNIADGQRKRQTMLDEGIPRVRYIPNFINEEKFVAPPERASKVGDKFRFFTLAGLVEGKGLDVLLESIAVLPEKESYHFVIGGDGPLKEVLQARARELGIDRHLEWKGLLNRPQTIAEFQASDCFVLPSRHESFGIVYVEALFCGRPVVATRCGGPEEYVNATTGLLTTVDDVAELAAAMQAMRRSYSSYDPQAIREWAFARYGSRSVCAQIVASYREVVAARNEGKTSPTK